MDKSSFEHQLRESAEYVIAHAKWQRSRGRRPSEPFMGIRNPAEALRVAQALIAYPYALPNLTQPSYSRSTCFYGPPKAIGIGMFEVSAAIGTSITSAIRDAINIAQGLQSRIRFTFNDVIVSVLPGSDPALIYRDWSRAIDGCIGKSIGPNPARFLTDEELVNDHRVRDENERRWQAQQAEWAAEAAAKRALVETKLAGAPRMEESDPEAWETFIMANQNSYGRGIIEYAERWARLMQLEMANGKTLEEVAQATAQEADIDGMSGFSYGAAVSTLVACWKHGDQLRRWHNLDTQLGDEGERANETGGVLNPALLNIGA